jgi:DNA-binding MarR family transcriptional regulator
MNLRATAIARALIHLLSYIRERHKAEFPRDITQAGIAKALKTRRSHVSTTLSSLQKKGYVEHRLGRVAKEFRRRKVYFLTWKGYSRATQMRDYYMRRRIRVPFNGSLRIVRIADLNGMLGENHLLVDILSCINEEGVLDLGFLMSRSSPDEGGEPSMEHERQNIKSDSRGAIALYLLFKA